MQKEEAERALQLFWEFLGRAGADDPDQLNAYKEVISGLHVYLTDILPASLPCLRAERTRWTSGRDTNGAERQTKHRRPLLQSRRKAGHCSRQSQLERRVVARRQPGQSYNGEPHRAGQRRLERRPSGKRRPTVGD